MSYKLYAYKYRSAVAVFVGIIRIQLHSSSFRQSPYSVQHRYVQIYDCAAMFIYICVVLGGVAEVVGSNLAGGKIFTASIGSVDSLYPSVFIYCLIHISF